MSKKYQVFVTGNLDDDFEIEADNPTEAMEKAEEEFRNTHQLPWSEVNTDSYELVGPGEADDLDDGY